MSTVVIYLLCTLGPFFGLSACATGLVMRCGLRRNRQRERLALSVRQDLALWELEYQDWRAAKDV